MKRFGPNVAVFNEAQRRRYLRIQQRKQMKKQLEEFLKEIPVDYISIDIDDMGLLQVDFIEYSKENVFLYENPNTEKGFERFIKILKDHPNMQILYLSINLYLFPKEHLSWLESVVQLMPKVTHFHFQNKNTEMEHSNKITIFFDHLVTFLPKLTSLQMDLIGFDNSIILKSVFNQLTNLRNLDLSSRIGGWELEDYWVGNIDMIVSVFTESKNPLISIDLSGNLLCSALIPLAKVLLSYSTLQTIILAGCDLQSSDISTITQGLSKNLSITELYLQRNRIDDEGVCQITEALKVNTRLRRLSLQNTVEITSKSIVPVAQCLTSNSTLKYLNMDDTEMCEDNIEELLLALQRNFTLETFKLDTQNVPKRDEELFQGYLLYNKVNSSECYGLNVSGELGEKLLVLKKSFLIPKELMIKIGKIIVSLSPNLKKAILKGHRYKPLDLS